MAEATGSPPRPSEAFAACEQRVLKVLRDLAGELRGPRAVRAVTPTASLERDVGLASLERVEFLLRLESMFERELDPRFFLMDSVSEITQALVASTGGTSPRAERQEAAVPAASETVEDARTLQEALWRRAVADADRPHVYLLDDDGREQQITYGQLWDQAAAVAGGLRERGARRAETVGLMLPTGIDFLASFMGSLVAGAVPVPLYPPLRLDRIEEYCRRQAGILTNAGTRSLITLPEAMPVVRLLREAAPTFAEATTAGDLARPGVRARLGPGEPEDPALIQYTSGSTGDPKGVLLTHANILANIRAIAAGVELRPTDVTASWLPLYHDMGLIGAWLFCLWQGIPIVLQSPVSFLARPERWLWAIHRRRATLSAAPNFAYELCVRKIPDRAIEGLDLSSWRCALNGAEPVSPDTLDRFARRFEPYGFRREALLPAYGLAESAVALCFTPVGRGPLVDRVARDPFEREGRAEPASGRDRSALRFVSVGGALQGHEVSIVNDRGEDLPERAVGRLVFRGPSATPGYFRNPQATAEITLAGGWLDSGDDAYRAAGEFYITGRRKEVILKAGRNLVPQEIEEIAASVEGIRKGSVAAFGVPDAALGTEALIVVAETRATDPGEQSDLEAGVVARIAAAIGVPPDRVALVPAGSVPKTSSGKIRRGATRELFVAGILGERPRTPLSRRLALVAGSVWSRMRPGLSRAGRALYLAYLALAFAVAAPVMWGLAKVLPGGGAIFRLGRFAARLALRLAGCRLSVEGRERLPKEGPFVLASNHASYADIPALMALLPMDFVFVAKEQVLSWPVVGTFAKKGRHPTVERWGSARSAADAEAMIRVVRGGDPMLFFPEGTFAAAAGLRPFRPGAFKTAVDAGASVVPLALQGTRRVLRGDHWLPRPGAIHLWIGPPIAPEGEGWDAVIRLRDRVADAIAAHCGEPRLDLVSSAPAAR